MNVSSVKRQVILGRREWIESPLSLPTWATGMTECHHLAPNSFRLSPYVRSPPLASLLAWRVEEGSVAALEAIAGGERGAGWR